MISKKFTKALKLHPERHYVIALQAGIHPSTLSKLVNGIAKPKPHDPRVVAVGKVLGLSPDECFCDQATGQQCAVCEGEGRCDHEQV